MEPSPSRTPPTPTSTSFPDQTTPTSPSSQVSLLSSSLVTRSPTKLDYGCYMVEQVLADTIIIIAQCSLPTLVDSSVNSPSSQTCYFLSQDEDMGVVAGVVVSLLVLLVLLGLCGLWFFLPLITGVNTHTHTHTVTNVIYLSSHWPQYTCGSLRSIISTCL